MKYNNATENHICTKQRNEVKYKNIKNFPDERVQQLLTTAKHPKKSQNAKKNIKNVTLLKCEIFQ